MLFNICAQTDRNTHVCDVKDTTKSLMNTEILHLHKNKIVQVHYAGVRMNLNDINLVWIKVIKTLFLPFKQNFKNIVQLARRSVNF